MNRTIRLLGSIVLAGASCAYAAGGRETGELGLLTLLFLGFFALIIAMQLIPGVVLFCSMLKSLWTPRLGKETVPATSGGEEKRNA